MGSAPAVGHFNDDAYADVAVGVSDEEVSGKGAAGRFAGLKVEPDTLEPATALAEGDLGFPAGSDGDAFGIALAH